MLGFSRKQESVLKRGVSVVVAGDYNDYAAVVLDVYAPTGRVTTSLYDPVKHEWQTYVVDVDRISVAGTNAKADVAFTAMPA